MRGKLRRHPGVPLGADRHFGLRRIVALASSDSGMPVTLSGCVEHASDGLTPSGDIRATPEYKKHLARVLTNRLFDIAILRTGHEPHLPRA